MRFATFLRCGAYPIVFGSVSAFVLIWSTLGLSPWPAFLLAAIAGLVAIAWLERVQPFESDWNEDHNDTLTDAIHVLVNLLLMSGTAYLLHLLMGRVPTTMIWPQAWPIALQVLLAGLIVDFGLFAMHRASHHVPWLWRLHAVHHSSERLYWMNGDRRHPLSALILAGPGLTAAALLGAPAAVITAWLTLLTVHLGFQHANLDYSLGPLSRWIGGAELHRWHHRRDYADAQVNFGEFWLLWDWLLGTRFDDPKTVGADDVGLDDTGFPTSYLDQLRWPFSKDGYGDATGSMRSTISSAASAATEPET